MTNKASVLFYELGNFSNSLLEKLSSDLKANPFSEEKGFGFQNIELHSTYLSASLLKRTPTFISEYNSETNELIKNRIYNYSNIKFSIDADFNLLEIYSSQKDSSKVRSALADFLGERVSIKQVTISPFVAIPLLNEYCSSVQVSKLTINNFNYNNKAYGLFSVKKLASEYIDELFSKYREDIRKISVIIDFEHNKKVEFSINESGHITIKADDFDDALLTIKSIILKR